MWGFRTVGVAIALLTILLALTSHWYTQELAEEREARVTALLMTPAYEECLYDETTCPQVEEAVQVPNYLGIGVIVLALILAAYLFRSDNKYNDVLRELRRADEERSEEERTELIMSLLKPDEQKTLKAIKEQPGITQHTLKLRVDFSKAKLSAVLKELETRGLVKKEADGKTNRLHPKRRI